MAETKKVKVTEYPVGPSRNTGTRIDWWTAKKGADVSASLFSLVSQIREYQINRRLDFLRYGRLFVNRDLEETLSGLPLAAVEQRLSFNVVKSCVNTACAKISKAKPRPLFLTEDGLYSQRRRAKKLTQFMDGLQIDLKMHPKGRKAFRDAAIFGTGLLKVFPNKGRVACERVFPDEVTVDDIDGREGNPRQMFQVTAVPKDVLKKAFNLTGDKETAINLARTASEIYQTQDIRISERAIVVEGWYLPSSEGADDGRHVISVSNETLLDKPWTRMKFPFAKMCWEEGLLGWWGDGLAGALTGIQLEVNNVLQRIKEGLELIAIPRIFLEGRAGTTASTFTDEIGHYVYYEGKEPVINTPRAFTEEVYNFLEYLYKKAFEETGISQLSAQSKKPAGLDSGVALREYQDIETERFALVGEAYQQLHLDAADIAIDVQKELAEDPDTEEEHKVKVKKDGFIETIKWKEVDMDRDRFIMCAYPTNFLPRTPEGKLQFTQELIQAGYISPEEAVSLLDFPDLERFFNLRTAAMDDVDHSLEQMLEHGNYIVPEPYTDLQLALKMAQSAVLRGKLQGFSESRIELVRRYIDDVQDLVLQTLPPAPQPGAVPPPGGIPGAVAQPAKPPTSDLLPIPPQGA